METGVTLQVKDDIAYYMVRWSALTLADRWSISGKVPAVGGVYEIYWMDDHQHLRMLSVGCTHYGGLRSELRRLTDPELTTDKEIRRILEDKEIWYRYVITNSPRIMADLVWFFRVTYFPENPGVEHSGQYKKIYLKESDPDKLIWVP